MPTGRPLHIAVRGGSTRIGLDLVSNISIALGRTPLSALKGSGSGVQAIHQHTCWRNVQLNLVSDL